MNTKVMECFCKHPFQDSRYGARMRLFNENSKGFACTVCGRQVDEYKPLKKKAN